MEKKPRAACCFGPRKKEKDIGPECNIKGSAAGNCFFKFDSKFEFKSKRVLNIFKPNFELDTKIE
jgi:hypothetical protein